MGGAMNGYPEVSEWVRGDDDVVGGGCEVRAGDYFVEIITDPYEGHVLVHVSTARRLLEALPRAIAHVEASPRHNHNP